MIESFKRVKKLCREIIFSGAKQANGSDKLYLFYCLDIGKYYNSQIEHFLTDDEKSRVQKIHFPENKYTYATAHAFLNLQLVKRLKCTIEDLKFSFNSNNKPYIPNSDIRFNLSHSRNSWAVVINGTSELGVDVEYINEKRNLSQITEHYFTPYEQIRITYADNPVLEFYKIWTRKEAYLKMKGIGINTNLQKLDVERICQPKGGIINSIHGSTGYIETFEFPNHVISVAQCKRLPVLTQEITIQQLHECLLYNIDMHQPIQISL